MRRTKRASASPAGIMGALRAGFRGAFMGAVNNPILTTAIAAPLIGMGIRHAETRSYERREAADKQLAFKEMMQLHPHFKEHDQQRLIRVYNSIHNLSPQIARDPLTAGAFVDQAFSDMPHGATSMRSLIPMTDRLSGVNKSLTDAVGKQRATPHADRWEPYLANLGDTVARANKQSIDFQNKEYNDHLDEKEKRIERANNQFHDNQRRAYQTQLDAYADNQGVSRFKFKGASRTTLGAMLRELKV